MSHTVINRPSPKFVVSCARLKFLWGRGQAGAIDTFNIPCTILSLLIPLKVVLEEIP